MSDFKVKDRVTFRPGPRAKADVSGTITSFTQLPGKGSGTSSFAVIACDDNKERKARPGSLRKAV